MADTHFSTVAPSGVASLALAANPARVSAMFVNDGPVQVYLGQAGVTPATGLPIPTGGDIVDSASNSAWYVVTDGGVSDMRICEVY